LSSGVGIILLAVGSAVVGGLAGEARVARALEAEATAKAAVAARKKKKAEKEKESAEGERDTAVSMLEKGRRVSAVLRSAKVDLDGVLRKLKSSYYSLHSIDAKREKGSRLWPRVEAFCVSVPDDTASQAAMLAAKAWLKRLAGYEEEAVEILEQAKKEDPDVAYGPLIEAMIWLSKYLAGHKLPKLHLGYDGISFLGEMKENRDQTEARARFGEALVMVQKARVWGESASEDFEAVLDGFRAFEEGDLKRAEMGLSKALAVPEMAWIKEEVLLARAKIRYLAKDFQKGISDIEQILKIVPDHFEAFYYLGSLWDGAALAERWQSRDPRPSLWKAVAAYRKLLDIAPGAIPIHLNLGNTFVNLGGAAHQRGEDATESFETAIMHFTRLKAYPEKTQVALLGRGGAYFCIGEAKPHGSREAFEAYGKSIADFGEAIRLNPEDAEAFAGRAQSRIHLGIVMMARGEDPTSTHDKGLVDAKTALEKSPGLLNGFRTLIRAYREIARFKKSRAKDPMVTLRECMKVCNEALDAHPREFILLIDRAGTHMGIADGEWESGKDPTASFQKAAEDYRGALDLNPESTAAHLGAGRALTSIGGAMINAGGNPEPYLTQGKSHLEKALQYDPLCWDAMAHLGMVAQNREKYKEALEFYRKALGIAGIRPGWIMDAIREVEAIMRTPPDFKRPVWFADLGRCQAPFEKGEMKAARDILESAIEKAKALEHYGKPEYAFALAAVHYHLSGIYCLASTGQVVRRGEHSPMSSEEVRKAKETAILHLRKAIDFGYNKPDAIVKDPDFKPILDEPEFKALLQSWEKKLEGR